MTLFGQILTGATALHLVFVIVLLLTRREERKDHSLAMTVFFLALLATNAEDIFRLFRPESDARLIAPLSMPALLLLGPAINFYCRALVSPEIIRFNGKEWRHLLPYGAALVLIVFAISVTPYNTPYDPKSGDPAPGWILVRTGAILTFILLYVAATSLYLVRTLRLLARYRRSKFDYFAAIEGKSLTWFEWMIALLSIIWIVNVLLLAGSFIGGPLDLSQDNQALIQAGWIYILSFMVLWQQAIFKPHRQGQGPEAAGGMENTEAGPANAKYRRSSLDEERALRIHGKIERAMRENALHRNQSLTLRHLSDHTRVPENYLSQVLNEYLGRNFYDYINHWRIKDACALLAEDKYAIIEIGEEVGFNSRSTFNAAFKKETGLTPREFRAARRNAA